MYVYVLGGQRVTLRSAFFPAEFRSSGVAAITFIHRAIPLAPSQVSASTLGGLEGGVAACMPAGPPPPAPVSDSQIGNWGKKEREKRGTERGFLSNKKD